VSAAAKLVLEPIFEADFEDNALIATIKRAYALASRGKLLLYVGFMPLRKALPSPGTIVAPSRTVGISDARGKIHAQGARGSPAEPTRRADGRSFRG
jgi:hypothetical protein